MKKLLDEEENSSGKKIVDKVREFLINKFSDEEDESRDEKFINGAWKFCMGLSEFFSRLLCSAFSAI